MMKREEEARKLKYKKKGVSKWKMEEKPIIEEDWNVRREYL